MGGASNKQLKHLRLLITNMEKQIMRAAHTKHEETGKGYREHNMGRQITSEA